MGLDVSLFKLFIAARFAGRTSYSLLKPCGAIAVALRRRKESRQKWLGAGET
jgi:hypothetical protein